MPFCSTVNVVNPGSVDTCTLYDTAPDECIHVSAEFVDTPVAPSAGSTGTGVLGRTAIVVKLHTADHALVPPVLRALTRQ